MFVSYPIVSASYSYPIVYHVMVNFVCNVSVTYGTIHGKQTSVGFGNSKFTLKWHMWFLHVKHITYYITLKKEVIPGSLTWSASTWSKYIKIRNDVNVCVFVNLSDNIFGHDSPQKFILYPNICNLTLNVRMLYCLMF